MNTQDETALEIPAIFEEIPGSKSYSIRYKDRAGRLHSEWIGDQVKAEAALAKKTAHLPRGVFEKVPGSKMYWIRYAGADGIVHREAVGPLSAAKELVEKRRVEKRKGQTPKVAERRRKRITFGELVTDAVKYVKSVDSKKHAYDTELKFNRMLPAFKDRAAESITREEILDWLDEQVEVYDWTDATYNRYVAAFSLIYSVAGPDGNKKLQSKPWGTITSRQEDNSRVRFLSQEEEAAITAILRQRYPDYIHVFILVLHTGARTSEILRGVVGDYDPKTGMITIHQRKDKKKPKVRYVPATPMAIEAYNALAAGRKRGAPLCINRKGGDLYELRYWLVPAIEASGVTDFTPHDLRHTAASRWVMAGVPLAAVAKYLGHSGAEMVMRYAHLVPEVNAKAIEASMSYYPKPKDGQ